MKPINELSQKKENELLIKKTFFDPSEFKPLSAQKLINILGLTIKKDEENKLITFLCLLSAYTEDSQFNISFNAPSSTGKSYIPTEIARLFPSDDVRETGYCSPTAFYHDSGTFNKERKSIDIDLSRKILIFLDQPHSMLLERLRSLLSHDKKELKVKITDKSQKGGLRTKNVFIKGFPAVIFCSAGLKIDEQEGTRFFLLSPNIDQEKIRISIIERIKRETDKLSYNRWLSSDPDRTELIKRILAIKYEKINDIKIADTETIERLFLSNKTILKPRHQRDIGRFISLVKCFALLNFWFRERNGKTIIANNEDIQEAYKIFSKISVSQEYNLPPYIYNLYQDVILPAYQDKNNSSEVKIGISRQDISRKHSEVYGRMIEDFRLRQQILPMLDASGLIIQEPDINDKRKILIYPTTTLTISTSQNNSELNMGVDNKEIINLTQEDIPF